MSSLTEIKPILSAGGLPIPGATRVGDTLWQFVVWAPRAETVAVVLLGDSSRSVPMLRDERAFFSVTIDDLQPGQLYKFCLNGSAERPDPASRFQPEGVHGPSQLVDTGSFQWTDDRWRGTDLEKTIFYELHVGAYTDAGTFDGLIDSLDYIASLGITAIELMPVAQFPGARNWGYDGALLYAPQNSYGGPLGLHRLIDAAHNRGLAVFLDVVYNHLGPEGNYLSEFGPYFTDRYHSPWGSAINFDGGASEPIREFFIQNALYWLEHYHFDGLRLDAIFGIFDFGARHFLAQLSDEVAALSTRVHRPLYLVAESDLNDSRVLLSKDRGGYDLHAQWSDDFHHSLHTLLTGDRAGYYSDFGSLHDLAQTLRDGWLYSGQYSKFRDRNHGNSTLGIARHRHVVCSQNHDQIGNRVLGDRLSTLLDFESQKLAAATTILSPFIPLLFMGEEYCEPAPFLYFTNHGDPALIEAIRKGRIEEFSAFAWPGDVSDPDAEATFTSSRLHRPAKFEGRTLSLFEFYRQLIKFRNEHELWKQSDLQIDELTQPGILVSLDSVANPSRAIFYHFGKAAADFTFSLPAGTWDRALDSAQEIWSGPGSALPSEITGAEQLDLQMPPNSIAVFIKRDPRHQLGQGGN